ncbi:MAG: hypothetical protein MR413_08410 [Clostridia bacterium]|nr:hypothetical protein [Clostridia bacterium]
MHRRLPLFIYLSQCHDKDCLENIRVYLTGCGQDVVDKAISVKCTKAEIIWVFSDIEPVPFNRGFYSIDLKYFFKITLAVFTGASRPTEVEGLATFDKKVILFGSEGNAKIFASKYKHDAFDAQLWKKTNMPHAVVEVVDPITLGEKLVDVRDRKNCNCCDDDFDLASVPESVCRIFDDNLVFGGEQKRVYVSIGVFSIIKLERKVQLLIPSYDFCIPQKECVSATDNSPCDLFDRIDFPVDEFFPPERGEFLENGQDDPSEPRDDGGCGCR